MNCFFTDNGLKFTKKILCRVVDNTHIEMLDWLVTLKKLMNDGVSPQSPEAFDVAVKLSEIATKHVDNKEEIAKQMEKALESMEADTVDFKFPTILTPEEEVYLEEIGKSIKALYEAEQK